MKLPIFLRRGRTAFTIVELLVVMAIIALLAGLSMSNFQFAIRRAQSVNCAENLHGIGAAVLSYATDNNDFFPEINQMAPVNPPAYPASVPGLIGVLGNYGVSTNTIQCPVDMASGPSSSFTLYGSSYEWNPVVDDGTDPVTAISIGPISVTANPTRIRLCTDFLPIHNGKMNALYADGHTRSR
jgi:prepilin-type processing-associated H-X9-DG protein/prepilin-type N-terminal cleavage/methylation domain-containing protein